MLKRRRTSLTDWFHILATILVRLSAICHLLLYLLSSVEFFVAPADTCYVLSFSSIMLNTSLHNPAVKEKPNVDRFIAMNRGLNDGGDLPQELLEVSECPDEAA